MKPTAILLMLFCGAATALSAQTPAQIPAQSALLPEQPVAEQSLPETQPQAEPAGTMQIANIAQLTTDDYLTMQLPPLGVLIDNARQSPQVKYYEVVADEARSDLKSERRGWLKYFRATAGYQYGQMNSLTSSLTGGEGDIVYPYTGKKQDYWNVGGTVSIPLNDLFDRRNQVKRKKMAVEAADMQTERWHDDLAMKVINAYTSALQNLAMIRSQSEAVTLAAAQYKITENDFINGKIDAVTLSRQKNIQTTAIREYEQTRASLNNSLLTLEILSHTKIISK